jgi:hypothetical protein
MPERFLTVPAQLGVPAVYAFDRDSRVGEITATDAFGPVTMLDIAWTAHHDARELRALFATRSPVLALESDEREEFLDVVEQLAREWPGGRVIREYATVMYVAQRVTRAGRAGTT